MIGDAKAHALRMLRVDRTVIAVTLGLALAAGWVSYAIVQQQRSLLVASRYNSVFDLTQLGTAVARLGVELAMFDGSPDAVNAVSLRVALLRNHLSVVGNGEVSRTAEARREISDTVKALEQAAEDLSVSLSTLNHQGAGAQAERWKRLNAPLARMISLAHGAAGNRVLVNQAQLGESYRIMFALLGGLVLAGFGQMVIVLRRSGIMAHQARHDPLTNLPNRRSFAERLTHLVASGRGRFEVGVLLIDLDMFKQINDTMGHSAGDALLRIVGERLAPFSSESVLVARLGGDEFGVILQDRVDVACKAERLAGQIASVLAEPTQIEGKSHRIGTSIGIAVTQAGHDEAEVDLFRSADLALYEAKAAGRGCHRVHDSEMRDRLRDRQAIEDDLKGAMSRGELEPWYQPIVDNATGAIVSSEALLRWRHPERGLVSPALFIPIAEEIGLIDGMGAFVLLQACRDAVSWPDGPDVSVNLSARQFEGGKLVARVLAILAETGLAPNRLELEVTETVLMRDADDVQGQLAALRGHGIRIALDDFGTGYTSLGYLNTFTVDKIKIDQCFVRSLAAQPRSAAIVETICSLANRLGLVTAAEGIETTEHLDLVRAAGCRQGQGYLFAKPMPASEFRHFLEAAADLSLADEPAVLAA